MFKRGRVVLLLISTLACSGNNNPAAPQPTTAILTVVLDQGCQSRNVQSGDVYIDGLYVGVAHAGDSGVQKTVSLGDHTVEGKAYYLSGSLQGVLAYHWGPSTKTVAIGGYLATFTCQ